jgi:type IV secretory pathway VirB4 component
MQSVASDQLKRTQYYNLLSWSWGLASSDREQKYMIISDEAYLMLDPNVKESAVFLKNVEKRGRKYDVALVVASHSIVDFLHEKIRMEGQALLNLPTYKIFFGCDGVDLEEITKLYSLTEAEVELLSAKKRARALMFIGSKRLGIKFIIPEYKLKLSGKAGGR